MATSSWYCSTKVAIDSPTYLKLTTAIFIYLSGSMVKQIFVQQN